MPDRLRRVAMWFTQRLCPATGRRRQTRPVEASLTQRASALRGAALRPQRRPAFTLAADDHPLVHPYVFSPEEWARRRCEVHPRAMVRAS
jgi:hypothetical protein